MNALNDFVVAGGSYFGLPVDRVVEGSTLDVANGTMELVLRIELTPGEVEGIAKRMGVMRVEAEVDAAQAVKRDVIGVLTREQLRTQYNSLPAAQRSAFGSFAKYAAACGEADVYAKALDKIEDDTPVVPPHAWVPVGDLTEQQKMLAIGQDSEGTKYAMDPNDLTDVQRALIKGESDTKIFINPEGLT